MLNRLRKPGSRHLRGAGLALIAALLPGADAGADNHQQIIGATEIIEIEPSKMRIKARVDTGAQTSSIHAENIEIDAQGDPLGKPIAFDVVNRQGQSQRIESHVVKQVTVRTAEGMERRYAVPLTMTWQQHSKTVLVTLNDRSQMRYRLLLGRNWLSGDYLVDVDLNAED